MIDGSSLSDRVTKALRVYVRFMGVGASPSKALSIFTPDSATDWPSLRDSKTANGWDVKLTDVVSTVAERSGDNHVNGANILNCFIVEIFNSINFSH